MKSDHASDVIQFWNFSQFEGMLNDWHHRVNCGNLTYLNFIDHFLKVLADSAVLVQQNNSFINDISLHYYLFILSTRSAFFSLQAIYTVTVTVKSGATEN